MALTGTIKVSTQTLKNTASNFGSTASKIRSYTTQMMSTVQGLNGKWTGEAQASFWRKFSALQEDMNQIFNKIQEHVSDLNEMARLYENAENRNQSNFGGLKTDYVQPY